MSKKSRAVNRPILMIALAVLTILLGSLAWISANTLTSAPPSQVILPAEYLESFTPAQDHILIDVRTPEEFNSGHIAQAVNIPVESLQDRLDEVPENLPIVVYCRSGNRSARAAEILVAAGFSEIYDLGGIQAWVAEGLPIQ